MLKCRPLIISPAGAVAKYCDEHIGVCLSVCSREYLRNHTRDLYQFFVCVAYGLGPPPASLRYVICTSGFVDDITFFYNGSYIGMNFATKDRFHLHLLTAKSDIIQSPVIKEHNLTISKLLAN